MSARDAILAAAKVPEETGELLGQKVTFRGLTAGEQTELFDGRPMRKLLIPVCALGIVGDDGKPLFSEKDLTAFGKLGPLEDAFARIVRLTGPTEEEEANLEKKS